MLGHLSLTLRLSGAMVLGSEKNFETRHPKRNNKIFGAYNIAHQDGVIL